ncbi:MAG: hypothetical protein IKS85_06310 [Lachnospiraceae bacterium]|nr:hypothetical protein [Lachnospiraceae bacterium]
MKRIIGKILMGAVLVFTVGLLTGCSDVAEISHDGGESSMEGTDTHEDGNSVEGNVAQNVDAKALGNNEKSEIMLVERSTNFAWGHHDHGLFVDTEGKIYGFDFSRYPTYMAYDENAITFVERLEIIRENSEPVAFFNEKDVQSILELGETLSAEDEFTEEEKMYDYGQRTLYFYQPRTQELLMVKSTGDVDYIPKNKNAKEIAKKYESYMNWHGASITEAELSNGIPTVYSLDDINLMDFTAGDGSPWVGKWVLETKGQLKAFAEQSGIPVNEILADDEYPDDNECTYFIFVEAAGQKEDGGNPRGFWIQGNCIDFVCLDGTGAEEGTFVCHFAEIRKEDLFGVGEDILDLNGIAWKKF